MPEYNANIEGWLVVKGDRLCRLLEDIIKLTEKEEGTITMHELRKILRLMQVRISNEMHKKN